MPMIALCEIEPDPANVRIRPAAGAADDQLVASMRQLGLLQPIVLRRSAWTVENAPAWTIVAGHRRWNAARTLGWTEIPAVVIEPSADGEARLMQLSENAVRADMSAVDIWCAVERAAAEGQSDEAIALALNMTARRVAQLRAMGRLPTEVCDFIRAHGDMPDERHVRTMCQAPHDRVLSAFKQAQQKHRPGDYRFPWWTVAEACEFQRIPLKHARFELDLYDGPVFADLFADKEETEALDVAKFLELQRAWAADQPKVWAAKGFGRAEMLDCSQYGEPVLPSGYRQGEKLSPSARIKKDDRKGYAYFIAVCGHGEVHEGIYPIPAPKKVKRDDALKGELGTDEPAPAPKERAPITKAGMDDLHETKRRLVRQQLLTGCVASGEEVTTEEMLAVALALLDDRAGWAGPKCDGLYNEDGSLTFDRSRLLAIWARLTAWHVMPNTGVASLGVTEAIGQGLGISPVWTLDREKLDWLNKDALERLRVALKVPEQSTAKALKMKIIQRHAPRNTTGFATAVTLTPEHLAEIEWQPTKPIKSPHYSSDTAEAGDEDEGDDDLDIRDETDVDEDDGEALASAGLGTDEDYGGEREEAA